MKAKTISESTTTMTEMVMPNDTNPMGNLMGGNLMRWMDVAASICAGKHSEKHVVTASVDHVSFQKPINKGDIVTLHACVTRAWNTSLEIYVEVFAADIKGSNNRRCNDAYLTFVALDENYKPTPIGKVTPLTNEEQKRYESAARRREIRLVVAGRIKPSEAKEIKLFFGED